MNHWIDCRVCLPDIDDKVLIYQKDNNVQLVGTYLGNSKFHYADCCQGIQKTCTASHWMPLPEPPSEDNALQALKKAREALLNTQKMHAGMIKESEGNDMRISNRIVSYAIQVSLKDTDTQEEYISACEPVINNDFLKFTTFDSVEFFIPVSRIKYVKTVPIEQHGETYKFKLYKFYAFSINPECFNDIQKELKTFFNSGNQYAKQNS